MGKHLIRVSMVHWNEGALRNLLVGLTEQALQTQENCLDIVRRSPLVL